MVLIHFRQATSNFICVIILSFFLFAITALTDSSALIFYSSIPIFFVIYALYKFDITNAWVAFSIPWVLILIFANIPISEYSRDLNPNTVKIIILTLSIALFILPNNGVVIGYNNEEYLVRRKVMLRIFFFYIIFSILNVVLAGFVPLFNLLTTGDSQYMSFGIKGLYGLYNSFGNAFGLTAFYLWITKRDNVYRNIFFIVLIIFLLFMTRQNIISLLVESFVVYNYTVRKMSTIRVLGFFIFALFLFGLIGDLRVGGNINELAKIKSEYSWIPSFLIWPYAYSFFNILNLDNAIEMYRIPNLDLSSLSQLIPSFLRPEYEDTENVLEISSFTVGTFILPIYRDLGIWFLFFLVFFLCLLTNYYYNKLCIKGSYTAVSSYSVLFFCFSFSFFENFWFYLPIIFQIPIFYIIRRVVLKPIRKQEGIN